MWLDAAHTVKQRVQWYFVPEDRPWLPFWHSFGSSIWLSDPFDEDVVGEDVTGHTWVDGSPPGRYTGRHFCGDISWWQNGVPTAACVLQPVTSRGESICCGPFAGAYSCAYTGVFEGEGEGVLALLLI